MRFLLFFHFSLAQRRWIHKLLHNVGNEEVRVCLLSKLIMFSVLLSILLKLPIFFLYWTLRFLCLFGRNCQLITLEMTFFCMRLFFSSAFIVWLSIFPSFFVSDNKWVFIIFKTIAYGVGLCFQNMTAHALKKCFHFDNLVVHEININYEQNNHFEWENKCVWMHFGWTFWKFQI